MRKVCASIFTIGLVVLAASPAFAQQQGRQGRGGRGGPGGGGFAPTAAMLLNEPKVQEELKITDDQKAQLTKVTDKYKEEMATARKDMNREKMAELRKAESEEMDKTIPTVLKPEQAKRLKQLEVQAGGLNALTKEDVQTALKLTDEQKKSIKDAQEELTKDRQEMFQSAQGDRTKMAELFTKIQGMQKEALDKAVGTFNDDQKKEWKELNGEKFESRRSKAVQAAAAVGPAPPRRPQPISNPLG